MSCKSTTEAAAGSQEVNHLLDPEHILPLALLESSVERRHDTALVLFCFRKLFENSESVDYATGLQLDGS